MCHKLFDSAKEIEQRIADANHLLLCLEFDGTLTPHKSHPGLPALSQQTERVLWLLAGLDNISLAIVSGRERADLQSRVGIPGVIYAGNHALEISGPGCLFVEPSAVEHSAALEGLAASLTHELEQIPGILVENKGLTLSVHFREVAAEEAAKVRRIVHNTLAISRHPFLLTLGHLVYEIRPRTNWNKAEGVRWIMHELGKEDALVIYVGNDASDEVAFAALADGVTAKVGDSMGTAAHYRLEGPVEVRVSWNGSKRFGERRCRLIRMVRPRRCFSRLSLFLEAGKSMPARTSLRGHGQAVGILMLLQLPTHTIGVCSAH